jgi:hypothetical protein
MVSKFLAESQVYPNINNHHDTAGNKKPQVIPSPVSKEGSLFAMGQVR